MSHNYKILHHENVNGVNLTLRIDNRLNSPNSQRFTITYKNKEQKSAWPIKSLFLAVIFNVLALCFVRISIQAILVIIIVLSFLVFFWITHSVQSVDRVIIMQERAKRARDWGHSDSDSLGDEEDGRHPLRGYFLFIPPRNKESRQAGLRRPGLGGCERESMKAKRFYLESLLVIPTVGVQSSVKYVFGREDNFVPWSSIEDVIINEVIKLNRVLYILTLLVKTGSSTSNETSTSTNSESKLIPLFKYTKPRLVMLETIYSELQSLLMASQCEDADLGAGDKPSN